MMEEETIEQQNARCLKFAWRLFDQAYSQDPNFTNILGHFLHNSNGCVYSELPKKILEEVNTQEESPYMWDIYEKYRIEIQREAVAQLMMRDPVRFHTTCLWRMVKRD